ncbi:MAG: hypothetical protein IPO58_03855 [Betaproteobacteria bacterium]|nr:hypothetical protein [Betaproteobacteria bacterium]
MPTPIEQTSRHHALAQPDSSREAEMSISNFEAGQAQYRRQASPNTKACDTRKPARNAQADSWDVLASAETFVQPARSSQAPPTIERADQ